MYSAELLSAFLLNSLIISFPGGLWLASDVLLRVVLGFLGRVRGKLREAGVRMTCNVEEYRLGFLIYIKAKVHRNISRP